MDEPIDSGNTEWASVLEAVESYVTSNKDALLESPHLPGATSYIGDESSLADMHDLPISGDAFHGSDDASLGSFQEETLESIRCTNEELVRINAMLKQDFPSVFNEGILIAEEERAMMARVSAELEVVRGKWRKDVDRLVKMNAAKDETILHLQRIVFPTVRSSMAYSAESQERKLAETESEIQRLRELIESEHSAR
jgi:hypothetical protein